MIYSVFNWDSRQYHYFDGPGEQLGQRPSPRTTANDGRGHQLEDLLPVVPAGSRPVGTGVNARGRVATMEGLSAAGDVPSYEAPASQWGFSGVGADAPSNPLLTSPWLTLGLWCGAVWVGYRIAGMIGKYVERSVR